MSNKKKLDTKAGTKKLRDGITSGGMGIAGYWRMELRGPRGELKEYREVKNIALTTGLDYLADSLATATGATSSRFNYIAIGTSSTAPTSTDTTLTAETGTRVAGTKSKPSSRTFRVTASFASDNPAAAQTFREAALCVTNTAGTLLNHATFADVNKASNEAFSITVDHVFVTA